MAHFLKKLTILGPVRWSTILHSYPTIWVWILLKVTAFIPYNSFKRIKGKWKRDRGWTISNNLLTHQMTNLTSSNEIACLKVGHIKQEMAKNKNAKYLLIYFSSTELVARISRIRNPIWYEGSTVAVSPMHHSNFGLFKSQLFRITSALPKTFTKISQNVRIRD